MEGTISQSKEVAIPQRVITEPAYGAITTFVRDKKPLADPPRLNALTRKLSDPIPLNPKQVVEEFMTTSDHITALFNADIGLLRPALLKTHTESDLGGFEQDYQRFFADNPEALTILRLTSLLKDSGKSLCVKATGDNQQQAKYNKMVTDNVLASLDSETLADDAKEVVRLLVDQDIIGDALQGRFDQAKLDEIRKKWPKRFAANFDDFMIVSYLSDASAHTKYRPNSDVRPEDEERKQTLTFLFEEPEGEHPLTLTQPYSNVVAALFPERNVARILIPDNEETAPTSSHEYQISRDADDT